MKRILKIVSVIAISLTVSLFIGKQVFADDILKTAGLSELANVCYNYGIVKSNIGKLTNGLNIGDLFTGDGDHKVAIPNKYQNTINDNDLSCQQLVNGYDNIIGGKYTALIESTTYLKESAAIALAKKLGYESDGGSGGGTGGTTKNHVKYVYKLKDWNGSESKDYTHQLFVTGVKDGKFTDASTISVEKNGNPNLVDFVVIAGKKIEVHCNPPNAPFDTRNGCGDISISTGGSWDTFVDSVYQQLKDHRASYHSSTFNREDFAKIKTYTLLNYDKGSGAEGGADQGDDGDEVSGEWHFIDNNKTKAINKMLSSYSSFTSISDVKFTADQKKTLHQYYFKTYFKAKLVCEGDSDFDSLPSTAIKAKNITDKNCFATTTGGASGTTVHAIKPDLTWYVDYTLQQLVDNMTAEELTGASTSDPGSDPGGGSTGAEREPDCQTNAGALGWILCPVIDISSQMVEKVYSGLIEPYLSIDAALFDTSNKGGAAVREIWSIFQGFANLAFVIIFLFVIFSQLTGVGIDNYGIKKILPKLIIGAVLINMSYIICQLAVDLSNILGRAVGSMFKNIAGGINDMVSNLPVNLYPAQASDVTGKFADVETGVLIVVGIAAVLGVSAFLAAGPAIIIPALLALLSLVVGIFFLFAMLALRQAVAVILVVISPMAFAAYMLPNTKKLYDKWFQAFKGMLIAYPIASALVYGGDFVSKILLVAGGTAQLTSLGLVLSATVVAIAPIFFIPSVIKKGMNGIAGLGNIINKAQGNMRGAVRQPAQQRLNQSRLNDYKLRRSEERDAMTGARRKEKNFKRAQRTINKYKGESPNNLSAGKRAKYNIARRNDMSYRKEQSELSDEYFSTLDLKGIQDTMDTALQSGDLEMLVSGMNQLGAVDQSVLLEKMSVMTSSSEWKTMMQNDKSRTTLLNAMRSQKGNPVLQAYSKVVGSKKENYTMGLTEDTRDTDGNSVFQQAITDKLQGMGSDAVTSMDKDTMQWATNNGWADRFSSEQIAAGVGAGMSGKQAQNFAGLMTARSDANRQMDAATVSSEQLANGASLAMAASLSGGFSPEEVKNIAAGGNAASSVIAPGAVDSRITGGRIQTQIRNINNNNELAAKTNQAFASAADIKPGPQRVHLAGIDPGFSGGGNGGGGGNPNPPNPPNNP